MSENTDKGNTDPETEGQMFKMRRDDTPDPNADPQAREAEKSGADGEPEVEGSGRQLLGRDDTPDPNADPQAREAEKSGADGEPRSRARGATLPPRDDTPDPNEDPQARDRVKFH